MLATQKMIVSGPGRYETQLAGERGEIKMSTERGLLTKGPQVAPSSHSELRKSSMTVGFRPGRTVILDSLDRQSTSRKSDRPAKRKEVAQTLVRIIVKTAAPFGNVVVQWELKTKREGVWAGTILWPRIESN